MRKKGHDKFQGLFILKALIIMFNTESERPRKPAAAIFFSQVRYVVMILYIVF